MGTEAWGEAARRDLKPESPRKRGSHGVPLHTWLFAGARLPQLSPRSQGNVLLLPAWASLWMTSFLVRAADFLFELGVGVPQAGFYQTGSGPGQVGGACCLREKTVP